MQEKTTNNLRVTAVSRPMLPESKHNGTLGDSTVSAGFPSPAEDSFETFDIVSHIVRHPAATFFMKVAGDSMIDAGIFDSDLIVVDRSLEAKSGDIVIAVLDGEFTIKRLQCSGSRTELVPENSKYRKIVLNEEIEFEVWGVVTGTYKSFK